MLHPSYIDLINTVNSTVPEGEAPLVESRYSIVIAAAKRARQLISGQDPMVKMSPGKKPLSMAVEELNSGRLKLSREGEAPEEILSVEEDADMTGRKTEEASKRVSAENEISEEISEEVSEEISIEE